ncbi:MAG: hypothetical protein C0598_00150 [Marinilabiliales bacterium]|nr:MAG: hypothetical protein C0598_00150 [Marinilabiliales bacterium]
MIDKKENINEILRSKFVDYEATPPPQVWENIEKELVSSSIFSYKYVYIALIAILLFVSPAAYFGFFRNSEIKEHKSENQTLTETFVEEKNILPVSDENNVTTASESAQIEDAESITTPENNTIVIKEETIIRVSDKPKKQIPKGSDIKNSDLVGEDVSDINIIKLKEGFIIEEEKPVVINSLSSVSLSDQQIDLSDLPLNNDDEIIKTLTDKQKKTTFWEYSVLMSPEFSLTKMDSVSILPTYSFGVEPMKYINKHWFVRSGINIAYAADRGFAKVDYMSKDMMGTYDDVIDVSFDTIDGEMVTIYNTKTVEVWDSVQHIIVTEITNRYLYAHIPALLGYKNKIGNINWYVYGGPAVGFQVSEWLENPMSDNDEVTIIDLDNKLPLRSKFNYQLWLGAGLEYKLGKRYSFVIEPTYKHYFKSLYEKPSYKINTSGFALRFGLHIKIVN